jgi:hypothetical protein
MWTEWTTAINQNAFSELTVKPVIESLIQLQIESRLRPIREAQQTVFERIIPPIDVRLGQHVGVLRMLESGGRIEALEERVAALESQAASEPTNSE